MPESAPRSAVRPSVYPDYERGLRLGSFEPTKIVARKYVSRWITGAIALAIFVSFIYTLGSRPALSWDVVGIYLFSPQILEGLVVTIYLTMLAMSIGLFLGLVAAIMTRSKNPVLCTMALIYIWVFRAVPGLVQLLLWYNLASLFPTIDIGIPYGPVFWQLNPNEIVTPLLAACLGLGMSEGAYMAEIIRGGLLSVPKGQAEAAGALGLTSGQTLRKVVMPQAMRSITPAIGNAFIGMLKYTSLASVISVTELLHSAQSIYAANFQIIPLLLVASIWYLVVTSILTLIQRQIEDRFNRGFDQRSHEVNSRPGRVYWRLRRRRPDSPEQLA